MRDKRAAMSDVVTSACVWAQSRSQAVGKKEGQRQVVARARVEKGDGASESREETWPGVERRERIEALGGGGRRGDSDEQA